MAGPPTGGGCIGDCSDDGVVAVNELISGVNIARQLGRQHVSVVRHERRRDGRHQRADRRRQLAAERLRRLRTMIRGADTARPARSGRFGSLAAGRVVARAGQQARTQRLRVHPEVAADGGERHRPDRRRPRSIAGRHRAARRQRARARSAAGRCRRRQHLDHQPPGRRSRSADTRSAALTSFIVRYSFCHITIAADGDKGVARDDCDAVRRPGLLDDGAAWRPRRPRSAPRPARRGARRGTAGSPARAPR